MPKKAVLKAVSRIEKERAQFPQLIAENPNYFGNLVDSAFKPVKKVIGNTKYEQLTCVGFNPDLNRIEATLQIKLPFGYGGSLCHAGTVEYVRFFIDYGGGWVDVGTAGVNVHDLPNHSDCAKNPDKPITYVVTHVLEPKQDYCLHPVLPKVRAILSWNLSPPANPNWPPVWGNVLDRHIQIKPRRWFISDVVDLLSVNSGTKLVVPLELEEVKLKPIPLPDPPPIVLSELAKLYVAPGASRGRKDELKTVVEPHRFGLPDIDAALANPALNQDTLVAKAVEWKALNLDWSAAVSALQKTSGNVTYEQLDCLGLDYNQEWLVATFRIKKPSGYSGGLCRKGSKEFVTFWADWDDTCDWKYVGTVSVDVHDISTIPAGGLHYAAILPVDLKYHRRPCKEPKVGRVRAVLSWAKAPSTSDPNALPYWGNRLDAHVQIRPGDRLHPGEVKPLLHRVGGIRVENISNVSGLTVVGATFSNGSSPEAGSPFADRVQIEGPSFPGYLYRVQVRNVSSGGIWTTVANTMEIEPLFGPKYYKSPVTPDGFFTYETLFNNPDMVLARWDTAGDEKWEVKLEIWAQPTVADQIIQLKNSGIEDTRIHIDPTSGGDCGKFTAGMVLSGHFVARDPYLSSYSIYTLPFGTPPGTLTPTGGTVQTPPAGPTPAPPPGGSSWTLDTTGMKSCGYVVKLDVADKAIRNSVPNSHHLDSASVGFCLLEEE